MKARTLPVETFTAEELAQLAQLRYVLDEEPGFKRACNGSGFCYLNGHGRHVRDRQALNRIESLAIPPAWTDVWICRQSRGHLQVTGRDSRGRKQYIYHEQWRAISNLTKFLRLNAVHRFLPALRRQVSRDLRPRGLSRSRVLAGMVAVLDLTSIRVGNEEYVRENGSYGLATLRNRHVTVEGSRAILRFRGKAGLRRAVVIEDKRLVRLFKQLKRLPGARVFQFIDEAGAIHPADATAVNDYLREQSGQQFTAKDFRTWKASSLAAESLYDEREIEKIAQRKKVIKNAIAKVAETLGNTTTVCRKYYIHSGLLDSYVEGQFAELFQRFRPTARNTLSRGEVLLAHFLHRWSPLLDAANSK
jgi:DNA topoisomerase I